MKMMKRLLSFVLTALLLVSLLPSAVHAEERLREGDFYYSVENGEATFLDVVETFSGVLVEIPETLGGCPVTTVAAYACRKLDRVGLTAVIPASVTNVGYDAFYHFDTVYLLGTEVEIEYLVFNHCTLYIYESVFRANKDNMRRETAFFLDEFPCAPIYLEPVTEGIFTYAVHNGETILLRAEGSGTVTVPNQLGDAPVVWIGPSCFCGEDTNYILPDTVACIGDAAFTGAEGSALERLPAGLKRLAYAALQGVELTDPTLPVGLEYIGMYACQGYCCDRLVIPYTVERVCYGAFEYAVIPEIIIEEGVRYLEPYCFYGVNHASVTIPRSVAEVDTIFGHENMEGLMVYGYADSAACAYCDRAGIPFTDLETGVVYTTPYETELDSVRYRVYPGRRAEVIKTLENCPDDLVIPETAEGVPVTLVDVWSIMSKTLRSLWLPDTVSSLGWHAVENCPNLRTVHMSAELKRLGTSFSNCPMLQVLYLPPSVTEISNGDYGEFNFFIENAAAPVLLAVEEGSYAEDFCRTRYSGVVSLKPDRDYLLSQNAVCEVRGEEAVLMGICAQSASEDSYYLVPDSVSGIPVTTIGADTVFAGRGSDLVLGENVTTIEPAALLGTGINTLYTTPTLTSLPKPLFSKPGIIYGYSGTYAEAYAAGTEDTFYAMDDVPFGDVEKTDWFFGAVYFCYWNRIMSGQSDEVFNPRGVTSRAMLVSILYRLCGSPSFQTESLYFYDVPDNQWYTAAVNWAATCGVVYGTTETTFSPNDPVSREQVATILFRFADLAGYDVNEFAPLGDFKDGNKVSSWARSAVMWAVEAGIISGTDEGRLNPQGNASRAEIASMIMRFVNWMEQLH